MILSDFEHLIVSGFYGLHSIYYFLTNHILSNNYTFFIKTLLQIYCIIDIYDKYYCKKDIIRNYEIITHHLSIICMFIFNLFDNTVINDIHFYKICILELSTCVLFIIRITKLYKYQTFFLFTWINTRLIYFPYFIINNIYNDNLTYIQILNLIIIHQLNIVWTLQALFNNLYKNNKNAFLYGYSSIFLIIIPILIYFENKYILNKNLVKLFLLNLFSILNNIFEQLNIKYYKLIKCIYITIINYISLKYLELSTNFCLPLFIIKYFVNYNIHHLIIVIVIIKQLTIIPQNIVIIPIIIFSYYKGLYTLENKILWHYGLSILLSYTF
jgi:hypothetical protein